MLKLILRADSFTGLGTGHVMRCLSLGQAFRDIGGDVLFITYCESKDLLNRLKQEGFEVLSSSHPHPHKASLDLTKDVLKSNTGAWVVVDGVHFDIDYHLFIKQRKGRLLIIDDMARLKSYCGDIILNQNLHAFDLEYNHDRKTTLLSGPKYAILRREFTDLQSYPKEIPPRARKILITLGGMDDKNRTQKVLASLVDISDIEIDVVIGSAFKHLKSIKDYIDASGMKASIVKNVTEMSKLMASADLAISSGGTTVWELAFMGAPAIIGEIAEIEEYLVRGLKKRGLFECIGPFDSISTKELSEVVLNLINDIKARSSMSVTGQRVVDGGGCKRVLEIIAAINRMK